MEILHLIQESRVEDFEKKYSQKFSQEMISRMVKAITPKFLDWVGKNLEVMNFDNKIVKLIELLNKFEKYSTNLPKTDLYQYKSIDELENELQNFENKDRRNLKKVEGGNIVYEDDRFFVVNPLTHQSSCYYGKGTKWCTASESDSHFTKYNEDGKLFYIIDKRLKTDDPYYKVALLYKFDKGKSWWDAKDIPFTKGWIFDSEEYQKIISEIDNYISTAYSEQVKIWSDKELAQKERKRLERIAYQRRIQRLQQDALARKENNEWALDQDCPLVGLKAHALLNWLEAQNDIEIRTNEDDIRLEEINNQIELSDSEDEISELEDEREELEKKNSVYDIVPIGSHVDMTTFEILNNPDLENRTYAVGDEAETEDSAKEATSNLIDDIGYDGFSRSFVTANLDRDKIREYASDVYENDVRDNPEVYFDDSERGLSDKQEERVDLLKSKIEKTKSQIEDLEEYESEEEDEEKIEYYQEKIEELNNFVTEWEEEILEIEESPDGDFPDELIDDKIEELVNDAVYDEVSFLENYGASLEDFIDKDGFIQAVIDSDGYGPSLNSYDGDIDEVQVLGETFFVMRID